MDKNTEQAEPQAAAPEEAGKKKPMGIVVKAGLIAVILLAQVAGAYFLQKAFLFKDSGVADAQAQVKKEEEEKKKKEEEKEGAELQVVMLDEIVVNPAETGGRRYLVVSLGLQTEAPEAEKTIEKFKPLIRDALITLLSAKHLDELSRISFRDTLRTEIKEAANRQLHGVTIDNVVFSSYVLQ